MAAARHGWLASWLPPLRHIEWSVDMIDLELETWETISWSRRRGALGLFVGPDLDRLQRHLALLGHGVSLNRDAVRTLVRRKDVQPGIPDSVRDLIKVSCERFLTNRRRNAERSGNPSTSSRTPPPVSNSGWLRSAQIAMAHSRPSLVFWPPSLWHPG